MPSSTARKAYRKWITARFLSRIPLLPGRFRQKMKKREMRYFDGRHYAYFTRTFNGQAPHTRSISSKKCIFIDVTNCCTDVRIHGFSRVVNKIVGELLKLDMANFSIEPVKYDRFCENWRYATTFKSRLLLVKENDDELIITFQKGDVFLGLDWNVGLFDGRNNQLKSLKKSGVTIAFVIYDIIPIYRSHLYVSGFAESFSRWAYGVAEIADTLICISNSVATEVDIWLGESKLVSRHGPKLKYFHLGSDIVNNNLYLDKKPRFTLKYKYNFLMVGTVEPRKGYRQALDAFHILWQQDLDLGLTIVGRKGWLVDDLVRDLQEEESKDGRLLWLRDGQDAELTFLYQRSSALLAASEAEGFGLPLMEAARHSLPIIARDIPVFREILGDGAFFFSAREPQQLASKIQQWLTLSAHGKLPAARLIVTKSWHDSAVELMSLLG